MLCDLLPHVSQYCQLPCFKIFLLNIKKRLSLLLDGTNKTMNLTRPNITAAWQCVRVCKDLC